MVPTAWQGLVNTGVSSILFNSKQSLKCVCFHFLQDSEPDCLHKMFQVKFDDDLVANSLVLLLIILME